MALGNIPINDANSVQTPVGAVDDGTQEHATAVSVMGEISELTGQTIQNGVNLDVAVDPVATYLIVDLGPNTPTFAWMTLAVRYSASGVFQQARVAYPTAIPQTLYAIGSHTAATTHLFGSNDSTLADGTRTVFVAAHGVETLRMTGIGAGSLTGVTVRQMAGPLPPELEFMPDLYVGTYTSAAHDDAAYADGEFIGGIVEATSGTFSPKYNLAVPTVRRVRINDYDGEIGDFDFYIGEPGANSSSADHASVAFDYAEAIAGVFEFRTTPGAGQYPIRTEANGAKYGFIPDLDIQLDYVSRISSTSFGVAQYALVARAAWTWTSAGNVFVEIGAKL